MISHDLNPTAQRTIILYQRQQTRDDGAVLEEIVQLAESAGALVKQVLTAYRRTPHRSTFLGSGKLDEVKSIVEQRKIDLVIVNNTITPIQERNLERALKVRVLDRTGLILDIFAQRARSHEGKLQVELAQLKYLSTRLVRGWTHLERQKGGIGLRGPGETQLETDRRLIGHRIKVLSKRIDAVSAQRALSRKARARVPVPTVSLVGYTNAGKSSLFNRLTESNVLVKDQLFATLDTTLRKLQLEDYGEVIISDTVGFIRDLPTDLVQAFKSTLEESASADLLLHVVDVAGTDRDQCIVEVEKVLADIGAADVPVVTVFNKIDLLANGSKQKTNSLGEVEAVWVSAHDGSGMELLKNAIGERLSASHRRYSVHIKLSAASLRAHMYRHSWVRQELVDGNDRIAFELMLSAADYGWLQKQEDILSIEAI